MKRWWLTAAALLLIAVALIVVIPPLQESISAWRRDTAQIVAPYALQAENDELRRQNEWYRAFLELKTVQPAITLADASVISFDPSDATGGFTVNVGAPDGVATGDPVLTDSGVIGVVHTVGTHWSHVRTLYHPEVSLGVMLSRTGEWGTTIGGSAATHTLTVARLPHGCAAKTGDLLVTSGLGGTCPRGLPVGTLASVQRHTDGITDRAEVFSCQRTAPARVMIVTSFVP